MKTKIKSGTPSPSTGCSTIDFLFYPLWLVLYEKCFKCRHFQRLPRTDFFWYFNPEIHFVCAWLRGLRFLFFAKPLPAFICSLNLHHKQFMWHQTTKSKNVHSDRTCRTNICNERHKAHPLEIRLAHSACLSCLKNQKVAENKQENTLLKTNNMRTRKAAYKPLIWPLIVRNLLKQCRFFIKNIDHCESWPKQ